MVTPKRQISLVVAAVLLLALGAAPAAANRSIEIAPEGITATGRLTFSSGVGNVICTTSITGSLRRAFPKREGSAAGVIAGLRWRECTGSQGSGEIVAVLNLNWSLTYESFRGTLPGITGIRLTILRFAVLLRAVISLMTNECLFEGELGTEFIVVGGTLARVVHVGNHQRLIRTLRGLCPEEIETKLALEFETTNRAILA
jgi:hypothetical protein